MSAVRQSSPARPARRTRTPAVDQACAEAIDLAREAAEETAGPGNVGEHLGLQSEADRVVTHFFTCLDPAYQGWHWAVTVARAARAKLVTVCECVLLPGESALRPPEWVPWLERLRPGDLGPGDLLPTASDDPRLAPGLTQISDATDHQAQWELGLGRARVLSAEGRDEAAARWYEGTSGPHAPIATAAPAQCATCGFFVPLAGAFRRVFGACANEYAPDDGKIVSVDHGCGAHSEAVVVPPPVETSEPIVDELGYDLIPAASISEEDEEALGHS
ncbi:DUF3027 domain-containing protein [Actinomadura craniellae]|uniref:DUF3027 domain-containing protein n=1 Tax=Actinomadura craniellae TaxID=2231787 RepID=A0A365H8P3_9ACTN|nr:DUF3027 domain-containing protein [Actinomadura craniellae]RAY15500.1 DUF3027 domain-containing protein [Actinomadura craniellae]